MGTPIIDRNMKTYNRCAFRMPDTFVVDNIDNGCDDVLWFHSSLYHGIDMLIACGLIVWKSLCNLRTKLPHSDDHLLDHCTPNTIPHSSYCWTSVPIHHHHHQYYYLQALYLLVWFYTNAGQCLRCCFSFVPFSDIQLICGMSIGTSALAHRCHNEQQ